MRFHSCCLTEIVALLHPGTGPRSIGASGELPLTSINPRLKRVCKACDTSGMKDKNITIFEIYILKKPDFAWPIKRSSIACCNENWGMVLVLQMLSTDLEDGAELMCQNPRLNSPQSATRQEALH